MFFRLRAECLAAFGCVDALEADLVLGFASVYFVVFFAFVLVMIALGLDGPSAMSAVATCINNLGPALGDVATSFAEVSAAAKWLLAGVMLLGRLEVFTVLVLLTPEFWRQ